jgi:hypothetical protein
MSRRRKSTDTTPFDTHRLEGSPCLPIDVLGVYALLTATL